MNAREQAIVLNLAAARTLYDRQHALSALAHLPRLDEDRRRELQRLTDETVAARRTDNTGADMLPPMVDASTVCQNLVPVAPSTVVPVLNELNRATVDEWVAGWAAASDLRAAGVTPPGPLLLHGPTGSGKSTLAQHVAGALRDRHLPVCLEAHNTVDSHMGCTGENLKKAFDACAKTRGLLLIEELDATAEVRGAAAGGAERENNRIAVALLRLMDTTAFPLVATTNRYQAIDPAILRRFEYQVLLDAPTPAARLQILAAVMNTAEVPSSLVDLPIEQAVPLARRVRRMAVMRRITCDEACAVLCAA